MRRLFSCLLLLSSIALSQDIDSGFHVNVREVQLKLSVLDAHGSPVSALKKEDVELLDAGEPARITSIKELQNTSLRVFVIADVSESLKLSGLSAGELLEQLSTLAVPRDTYHLYLLSDRLRETPEHVSAPFSQPLGTNVTALIDGVVQICGLIMNQEPDSAALIVVSDGEDNSSTKSYSQMLKACRRVRAPIYFVVPQVTGLRAWDFKIIQELARVTGGELLRVGEQRELGMALNSLKQKLHSGYLVSFVPSSSKSSFRRLRIIDRSGCALNFHFRSAYWLD